VLELLEVPIEPDVLDEPAAFGVVLVVPVPVVELPVPTPL